MKLGLKAFIIVFTIVFNIGLGYAYASQGDTRPAITYTNQSMGSLNGFDVHAILYDNPITPAKIDVVCTTLTSPSWSSTKDVAIDCVNYDPEFGR